MRGYIFPAAPAAAVRPAALGLNVAPAAARTQESAGPGAGASGVRP